MNLLTPVLEGKLRNGITRSQVIEFENMIKAHPASLSPDTLELHHHFLPGIYIRELHIPKGAITTGKIHKYECISILSKGKRATLVNGKIELVVAPYMQITPAGFKRVSLTLEDSIWTTVHLTDVTDIPTLEKELVCDTEEEYQAFCILEAERRKCLS